MCVRKRLYIYGNILEIYTQNVKSGTTSGDVMHYLHFLKVCPFFYIIHNEHGFILYTIILQQCI